MQHKVPCAARRAVGKLGVFGCVLFALGACTINRPPAYDSPAVTAVCDSQDGDTVTVSFREQTRKVTVDFVPSWDELYDICGESGGACVNLKKGVIYMIDDRRCAQHASHELGHVIGVPGMDAPGQVALRRNGFY